VHERTKKTATGPRRWLSSSGPPRILWILASAATLLANSAAAVLIATPDGSANVTDPGFFGWSYVGQVNGLTATYLGNGWVLTANHVGTGDFELGGTTYPWIPGTEVRLRTNPTTLADLLVFAISPSPALAPLPIRTTPPPVGEFLILIGCGRDRGGATSWDPNGAFPPPPEELFGWDWAATQTKRWGTNEVTALTTGLIAGTVSFYTEFDDGEILPEAQAATGDSGGAAFSINGAATELAGILYAIGPTPGQPPNTALFTNLTFIARLDFYYDELSQIIANPVPGPASGWNGPAGNWDDPSTWTPLAVPGEYAQVSVENTTASDWTLTYQSASTPDLWSLDVVATGSGAMTLSQSQDTLRTFSETLDGAAAEVVLSGGVHDVLQQLQILDGGFALSGSGALMVGQDLSIHDGSFVQTGGSSTIAGDLLIAPGPSDTGSYDLSGTGTLGVTGNVDIGPGGGLLTQSGGTQTVGGTISVAAGSAFDLGGGDVHALSLTNDGTLLAWGGTLHTDLSNNAAVSVVSPGVVTLDGDVVNSGSISVTHSVLEITGLFTNSGSYASDPSESRFADVVVTAAGSFVGEAGDVFKLSGDLLSSSTQYQAWDTRSATLRFEGGSGHIFQTTGASLGTTESGYIDNFAWGTLSLAAGDSLTLQDGDATPGGAVYVDVLELDGGLGQVAAITGNGLDIFYRSAVPANAYLQGQSYSLTGGGVLAPAGAISVPLAGPAGWVLSVALAASGLRLGRARPRMQTPSGNTG